MKKDDEEKEEEKEMKGIRRGRRIKSSSIS